MGRVTGNVVAELKRLDGWQVIASLGNTDGGVESTPRARLDVLAIDGGAIAIHAHDTDQHDVLLILVGDQRTRLLEALGCPNTRST